MAAAGGNGPLAPHMRSFVPWRCVGLIEEEPRANRYASYRGWVGLWPAKRSNVEATVHHNNIATTYVEGGRGGFKQQSTNRACGAAFAWRRRRLQKGEQSGRQQPTICRSGEGGMTKVGGATTTTMMTTAKRKEGGWISGPRASRRGRGEDRATTTTTTMTMMTTSNRMTSGMPHSLLATGERWRGGAKSCKKNQHNKWGGSSTTLSPPVRLDLRWRRRRQLASSSSRAHFVM